MTAKKQFLPGIGERLRAARKHVKLNIAQISGQLNLHRTSYYKNESGETAPSLQTLYHFHKHLNISMDWLLFGYGPMLLNSNTQNPNTPQIPPDTLQLIRDINSDALLKHEIMAYYLKKVTKKNKTTTQSPQNPVNHRMIIKNIIFLLLFSSVMI